MNKWTKISVELANKSNYLDRLFNVYPTKSRQNARNPRTKEKVVIPPRRKVVFKPSKKIKNELYKSKKFS